MIFLLHILQSRRLGLHLDVEKLYAFPDGRLEFGNFKNSFFCISLAVNLSSNVCFSSVVSIALKKLLNLSGSVESSFEISILSVSSFLDMRLFEMFSKAVIIVVSSFPLPLFFVIAYTCIRYLRIQVINIV